MLSDIDLRAQSIAFQGVTICFNSISIMLMRCHIDVRVSDSVSDLINFPFSFFPQTLHWKPTPRATSTDVKSKGNSGGKIDVVAETVAKESRKKTLVPFS